MGGARGGGAAAWRGGLPAHSFSRLHRCRLTASPIPSALTALPLSFSLYNDDASPGRYTALVGFAGVSAAISAIVACRRAACPPYASPVSFFTCALLQTRRLRFSYSLGVTLLLLYLVYLVTILYDGVTRIARPPE